MIILFSENAKALLSPNCKYIPTVGTYVNACSTCWNICKCWLPTFEFSCLPFGLNLQSEHDDQLIITLDFQVIIAGAGGAAHLPGMVASLTPLPVIGVPVTPEGAHLDGLDALLSIVQVTYTATHYTQSVFSNIQVLIERCHACHQVSIHGDALHSYRSSVAEKLACEEPYPDLGFELIFQRLGQIYL